MKSFPDKKRQKEFINTKPLLQETWKSKEGKIQRKRGWSTRPDIAEQFCEIGTEENLPYLAIGKLISTCDGKTLRCIGLTGDYVMRWK